jgi:hypothetical protein
MMISRVTVAAATCALVALSGCVSTRSSLADTADRLEHSSAALAQDTPRNSDYPTGYLRDTQQLAEDSRYFRHVAEDRDSSDGDVKAAFRRVSHSYLLVRDDVEHSDSREARDDLKPVTDAYLDLEREVGGYPVHRASAD